jgi:hypothetical protein
VSLGRDDILEKVIRIASADRRAFLQTASDRAMAEIAALEKGDGGLTFRNATAYVTQAGALGRSALSRIRDLTAGKPALDRYLTETLASLAKATDESRAQVASYYRSAAALKGFKPEAAKPTADEVRMKRSFPSKRPSEALRPDAL